MGDAAEKADSRWGLIKYFTSKAEDPELQNLKLVKWLIEFVDNEVGKNVTQLQISGEQGAGKTDLSFLLAELWKFQSNGRVILTNVKDVDGTVYVHTRDELEEWLNENPDKEFMFVFDEANKHASGSDHEEVIQQLFQLITFLRKKQGNYIIVGHVGTDIHPWIRELTTFIHKSSKKTATIYQRLNDSGDPENPIRTLRNVPKSSLSPNTFDESEWEWGEEQTRQCLGATKDGDRCGAVTRAEWGEEPDLFCDVHQNQDEPHPDVTPEELIDTQFENRVLDDESESIDGDEDEHPEKDAEDQPAIGDTGGGSDDNSESSEEKSEEPDNNIDGDEDEDGSQENRNTPSESDGDTRTDVRDESDEPSVENVPSRFWKIIEDRTGGAYRRETVDDLETVEKILSESQWEKLQEMLSDV